MKTTYNTMCGFGPRQYELTVDKPLYKYVMNNTPDGELPLWNHGGVSIWRIDGCGDECIAAYNFGNVYDKVHRHAIHYSTAGRPFIKKSNTRYYLDQFKRNNYPATH